MPVVAMAIPPLEEMGASIAGIESAVVEKLREASPRPPLTFSLFSPADRLSAVHCPS